jgi:hypothetical protein
VKCILVEHRNRTPALLHTARQKHIATLGVIHPGIRSVEQARDGARLKLDGVGLEGEYDPTALQSLRAATAGLTVVELASRGRMRLDGGGPITGAWQGLWPGIQIEHGGGAATAGPTSTPWINTNTGFLRFARAATDSAICVGKRPPKVLGQWRRARLYSPEGEVRELPVYPVADGTGIDIDRIGVVATLQLD